MTYHIEPSIITLICGTISARWESSVNLAIDKLSFSNAIKTLYKNLQEEIDSSEIVKPTFNYNLPSSEEEALNFALTNHPSIQVSLENVKVATSEQQRDLKMFHPNVNLVGSYKLDDAAHKEDNIDPSNEYEIGLELSFNLYNGGKDYANNITEGIWVMTAVDNAMTEIEKFLTDKNISLSEPDKKRLEQILEDVRYASYSEGFDAGYNFGYEAGYDFVLTTID